VTHNHNLAAPHDVETGLPTPPSGHDLAAYRSRNLSLLIAASVMSMGCLIVSQFHFLAITGWLLLFAPFFVFTLVYYGISFVVNLGSRDFDHDGHSRLVDAWRPDRHPSLDVWLPICREDIAVLRNTWTHVARLRAAYPGAVTVYVLDDGDDPDCARMAREFGFDYSVRENRGWMRKAGNLRHGFAISRGTYVLILDADFAPRSDLPSQLIPYLEADPELGIVQSPQHFRTHDRQTWVERGAGAVQELFYRLVQVSRDRLDAAICVGSCAIYRRAALATNGGSTLIGHSEDVHTGFDLRRNGWGLRYVPIPLAAGLCPSGPDAFFVQQYRWCKGSMSLLGSRKFWVHRMRLRTRLCYLSGFCYYVHTAVAVLVVPVIPVVLLAFLPDRVRAVNYVLIYPSLLFNYAVFPAWHRCAFGLTAYTVRFLYGWSHLFALWDILRRRPMDWRPTGSGVARAVNRRFWTAVRLYSGGAAVLWLVLAAWRMVGIGPLAFSFLFGTGTMNAVIVGMALSSRKQAAHHEEARRADTATDSYGAHARRRARSVLMPNPGRAIGFAASLLAVIAMIGTVVAARSGSHLATSALGPVPVTTKPVPGATGGSRSPRIQPGVPSPSSAAPGTPQVAPTRNVPARVAFPVQAPTVPGSAVPHLPPPQPRDASPTPQASTSPSGIPTPTPTPTPTTDPTAGASASPTPSRSSATFPSSGP
jgi:cellulose synthase/poly-beta-1,6-N-acetylglucosamine synthase-like glycosyltransferase